MVMMFERELVGFDLATMMKLCVVHDLGEAISGDTPAVDQYRDPCRAERERRDLIKLCEPLPTDLGREILALWDDYAAGASREAAMVKGFDKLETMLQHLVGLNEPGFDYGFNLTYGVLKTNAHPLLRQIRGVVDAETRKRLVR